MGMMVPQSMMYRRRRATLGGFAQLTLASGRPPSSASSNQASTGLGPNRSRKLRLILPPRLNSYVTSARLLCSRRNADHIVMGRGGASFRGSIARVLDRQMVGFDHRHGAAGHGAAGN